jgi:hypothetical protein
VRRVTIIMVLVLGSAGVAADYQRAIWRKT